MSQFDLDLVEREALGYIVRELEAGRTHLLTDSFLPFLRSLDAGDRLVLILKHFEGLEILMPESPPGNRWKVPPLLGRTIPAYWRIEGKAVCLYRDLLDLEPGENKRPEEARRRPGRPGDTDPRADEKIFDAWKSGGYKRYDELARKLETSKRDVAEAIDRHRHRLARDSANRRTNPPGR